MFLRKQELFYYFFKPHLHSPHSFQGKRFLPANTIDVLRVRLWNMRAPVQLCRFHVHSFGKSSRFPATACAAQSVFGEISSVHEAKPAGNKREELFGILSGPECSNPG